MVKGNLPNHDAISNDLTNSLLHFFLMSFSIGGVDIFVLISGWFGIHATRKGLAKYLYQVFFLLFLILLVFFIVDKKSVSVAAIKATFWLYSGYWFITAYLGLYLLSPILNAFISSATKRQFQLVLLSLYLFQCYFCWITNSVDYYGGYSIMFFCILYLSARYIRLYPIEIIKKHSLQFYILSCVAVALMALLGMFYTETALRMLRYDNPIVIFSSLCILSFFYDFHFKSRIVNEIAASCLAVYIIHFNPLVFPYFIKGLYVCRSFNDGCIALSEFLYLIMVFLCCVMIDRLRIITWNVLYKRKFLNK